MVVNSVLLFGIQEEEGVGQPGVLAYPNHEYSFNTFSNFWLKYKLKYKHYYILVFVYVAA